jgi:uncharacterized protein YbcV (DUF1398 family)
MNDQTLDALRHATRASLDGTMTFPQVVERLRSVGVAHYHVDLLRSEKTCYLRTGESHVEPLPLPSETIAAGFDGAGVAAAVRASQRDGQGYVDFVRRVKAAGCIGYVAYLDGRRVVYHGRLGDELVEPFPTAP